MPEAERFDLILVFPLFFMVLGLLALAFWIWMLVDCLQYEKDEENQKLVWALVIILTNWIGALIYFFVRRRERKLLEAKRNENP